MGMYRNPLAYAMLKHAWGYSRAAVRAKNDIDRQVNLSMFRYWYKTYVDYRRACG
jgi:hypothetical protein